MSLSTQQAKQIRELFLDGKWIAGTNYKEQLSDISWEEALIKMHDLNTVADLAFHVNYYLGGVLNVLKGGSLDIRDKYSFDRPPIESQKDWELLLTSFWRNAEEFADKVDALTEEQIMDNFVEEKYGNYYRNIVGLLEHSYYHFGQIVLIRKMVKGQAKELG